jgi:hypothetical protein
MLRIPSPTILGKRLCNRVISLAAQIRSWHLHPQGIHSKESHKYLQVLAHRKSKGQAPQLQIFSFCNRSVFGRIPRRSPLLQFRPCQFLLPFLRAWPVFSLFYSCGSGSLKLLHRCHLDRSQCHYWVISETSLSNNFGCVLTSGRNDTANNLTAQYECAVY